MLWWSRISSLMRNPTRKGARDMLRTCCVASNSIEGSTMDRLKKESFHSVWMQQINSLLNMIELKPYNIAQHQYISAYEAGWSPLHTIRTWHHSWGLTEKPPRWLVDESYDPPCWPDDPKDGVIDTNKKMVSAVLAMRIALASYCLDLTVYEGDVAARDMRKLLLIGKRIGAYRPIVERCALLAQDMGIRGDAWDSLKAEIFLP